MVYVFFLLACEQDQDGTPSWSSSQAVCKTVWHIPLLRVQWKTPDDGQRNCPKHVEFHSKNKLEKSVHLVGFIIRIYHDARSHERQQLNIMDKLLNFGGKQQTLGTALSVQIRSTIIHVLYTSLLSRLPLGEGVPMTDVSLRLNVGDWRWVYENVPEREQTNVQ
jgi:hypothetical protein